jgi:hypothetical protein
MAAYMTFIDSVQQEVAEFKRNQAEGTAREEARYVMFLNGGLNNQLSSLAML